MRVANLKAISLLVATAVSGSAFSAVPESKKGNGDKVICKTILQSGSRLNRTRECRTAEQWREMKRMQREFVDDAQRVRPVRQ